LAVIGAVVIIILLVVYVTHKKKEDNFTQPAQSKAEAYKAVFGK
jgi:hypothetical protein